MPRPILATGAAVSEDEFCWATHCGNAAFQRAIEATRLSIAVLDPVQFDLRNCEWTIVQCTYIAAVCEP